MHALLKILRLEKIFFKLSLIADLQQRFNVLAQFFNDILWYGVQIVLFESLYLHVQDLGGWNLAETRVFLGILFLVDALQMVFFAHNFDSFNERLVRGDLDLAFTKPVSPQCLMMLPRLQCGFFLNVLFAAAWLGWSLSLLGDPFHWTRCLFLLIVIPAGLSIFYAIRLMVATMSLLMLHAESFYEIFFALFKLGTRPDRVYGPGMRYFILMVLPVGMIASVPTRVLVDPFTPWPLASLLAVAASSLLIANRFWNWSLRRYTSA